MNNNLCVVPGPITSFFNRSNSRDKYEILIRSLQNLPKEKP